MDSSSGDGRRWCGATYIRSFSIGVRAYDSHRTDISPRSSHQHETISKSSRDRSASSKQRFQMRLGGLLESKRGLPAVTSLRMAPRQKIGFGDPHAVLVAANPNLGNGHESLHFSLMIDSRDNNLHSSF